MKRVVIAILIAVGLALPASAVASGSAQARHPEAMVLAVDNSESMRGRPLREAKRAAAEFLAQERRIGAVGLVAFGHEALPLTHPGDARDEVAQTLGSLASDTQRGTSLYDAVELSVSHLQRMSNQTRILVLLTDGRDVGSRSSLSRATAAAQRANVVVFAIAAGPRADRRPLTALANATGGEVFTAADVGGLSAAYRALGRELEGTWQPSSIIDSPLTAAVVVLLTACLLAAAGAAGIRMRRRSELRRRLDALVKGRDQRNEKSSGSGRFAALIDWTERSLEELPGYQRLARAVERSGLKLRIGQVPYLAAGASFFIGIVATIMGAGPGVSLLLMLAGLAVPFLVFRIAARRRRKAFDKQLPDVLSTIASTLRAGHGLRMSLRAVADDGSAPASEEFTRVLGEERLGRPLDQAITAMCERIESPDLDYVATAINVQSQAGGSLATLFDTLSDTVRERQRHARKVRALTSMGRMSATILICLPIGLTGLMTLISPKYMAPLFTKSAGHVLIGLCLASMTIGALFLKKIVNVRY